MPSEQRKYHRTAATPLTSHGGRVASERSGRRKTDADHLRSMPAKRPANATDIQGFSMSSCCRVVVGPGGGLVVEAAGLQAAVQDADEPIGELAWCCLVTDLAGSERVVVGACAGRSFQGAEGPLLHGVAQPRVAGVAG